MDFMQEWLDRFLDCFDHPLSKLGCDSTHDNCDFKLNEITKALRGE
jgi:hypothetical protein